MKVSELRIGNWINNGSDDIRVSATTFNFNMEWYNPIPLTEEWLKKFGFTGWDLGYYTLLMDSGAFAILTEDGMTIISRNIKHVHQLQNLYFALTGEELIFTP